MAISGPSSAVAAVAAGAPFRPSARQFRRFERATQWVEAQAFAGLGGDVPARGLTPALVALVRNDTLTAADNGRALTPGTDLAELAANPAAFAANPVFSGTAPAGEADTVAVLLDPLQPGQTGRAVVSGVAVAHVNVTDAGHGYAKPAAGSTQLVSDAKVGHRVVTKEAGTGSKWAVLLLGWTPAAVPSCDDWTEVDVVTDVEIGCSGSTPTITPTFTPIKLPPCPD